MIKIAINGFGRIGRLTLRRILEKHPELEVVAINDLTDPETLVYLLAHDSAYGAWEKRITLKSSKKGRGAFVVEGKETMVFNETNPLSLPWEELGIDLVIESTGVFTARADAAKHLEAGAKRVLISANSKDADISLVMGANEKDYNDNEHRVAANCSCTTNAAAPLMKILDEKLGIVKAQLMTVHALTASQSLIDSPKKDIREGRSAFVNIIPAGTGASEAVVQVLPKLKGKISGSAFRVPIITGSVLEIVATTKKETTNEQINKIFTKESEGKLKGIIAVSQDSLVSTDIIGSPYSAIVDLPLTEVLNLPKIKDENMVKIVAWYDNEYGYACRLAEMAEYIGKKL